MFGTHFEHQLFLKGHLPWMIITCMPSTWSAFLFLSHKKKKNKQKQNIIIKDWEFSAKPPHALFGLPVGPPKTFFLCSSGRAWMINYSLCQVNQSTCMLIYIYNSIFYLTSLCCSYIIYIMIPCIRRIDLCA